MRKSMFAFVGPVVVTSAFAGILIGQQMSTPAHDRFQPASASRELAPLPGDFKASAPAIQAAPVVQPVPAAVPVSVPDAVAVATPRTASAAPRVVQPQAEPVTSESPLTEARDGWNTGCEQSLVMHAQGHDFADSFFGPSASPGLDSHEDSLDSCRY